MKSAVATTGLGRSTFRALFRKKILQVKPQALGMAVAYVSVSGFNLVKRILEESGVGEVRLVTDTKDGVTHPRALESAVRSGWEVRVVDGLSGTFHPKLYVGAAGFGRSGNAQDLSLAIVGSPNVSRSGFLTNGECVFWSAAPHGRRAAATAWLDCWNAGVPATAQRRAAYERRFALRNRFRKPQDMVALGIIDGLPTQTGAPPKREHKTISEAAASVAWAGLQSFTGAYNLQVEFPKEAGLVLERICAGLSRGELVDILCADDQVREFRFRFYADNGMFRLNVPNSTPLVDWARKHRDGIAYVEYNGVTGGLRAEILPPSSRVSEIVDRSRALGTWGKTRTRLFGWY